MDSFTTITFERFCANPAMVYGISTVMGQERPERQYFDC